MKQKQDFTDKIKKISDILELGIPKISNKNLQSVKYMSWLLFTW